MAYQKKGNRGENPKLDMTPMIDVVFQLLIFFVVTLKQEDILSKLSAARPASSSSQSAKDKQDELITVVIAPQGYSFNGLRVGFDQLDMNIKRISSMSKTAMIVIKCTADSPHGSLVKVLNLCYKYGMSNMSIFSM